MLSRWLFGKVCMRWSQYLERAAVQTPVTDLMDEVSHTHLQCEHNHLHQTHMGQPSTMSYIHTTHTHRTMFFWSPLVVLVLFFYQSTFTSVFNVCSCLFIRSTLNRPLESSTCLKKCSKSSTITKSNCISKKKKKKSLTWMMKHTSF